MSARLLAQTDVNSTDTYIWQKITLNISPDMEKSKRIKLPQRWNFLDPQTYKEVFLLTSKNKITEISWVYTVNRHPVALWKRLENDSLDANFFGPSCLFFLNNQERTRSEKTWPNTAYQSAGIWWHNDIHFLFFFFFSFFFYLLFILLLF